MPNEPSALRRSAMLKINPWYRTASVLLGLAGLGSGGAAVFITHLEAGPVALLIVGLILLLVGMGGRMPTRIRIGDNEAAWEAVQEFVERVTEEAPEAAKPQLLDALTNLADAAPQAASGAVSALAYEALVENMLKALIFSTPELAQLELSLEIPVGRREFDAIVAGPERMLVVEIKAYSQRLPLRVLQQMAGMLAGVAARETRVVSGLLVTRTPPSPHAYTELRDSYDFYVVVVESANDADTLAQAVRAALGLEQADRRYFAR